MTQPNVQPDAQRHVRGPEILQRTPPHQADADAGSAAGSIIQDTLRDLGHPVVRPDTLIRLLETDVTDAQAVTQIIEASPVLTARVLAVINSAAMGISKRITDVNRAVLLLGPNRSRGIALAYGLRAMTEGISLPKSLIDMIWGNALQKAVCARRFCEVTLPAAADTAYAHALIQDIGLPMLAAVDVDYYMRKIVPGTGANAWSDHERERFGFDHAAVGQGLLLEWNASERIQQAVLSHHAPPTDRLDASDVSFVDMSCFFASLLPHMHEEPCGDKIDWLHAIHARFLASQFPTPDAFMQSVTDEVRALQSGVVIENPEPNQAVIRRLVDQVSTNAVAVTTRLCHLEASITRQQEGINDLKFKAFTDPLTKVLNRRGFAQLCERRLEVAAERHLPVCCMLCDLDDFKAVNDTHGHDAGDLVLRGLAKMLRRKLRDEDLVGRLGGDEFAVLITNIHESRAREAAQSIVDFIDGAKMRVRHELAITVHISLGAIHLSDMKPGTTIDDLLVRDDSAMYARKRAGKHGLVFHVPDMDYQAPDSAASTKTRRKKRDS